MYRCIVAPVDGTEFGEHALPLAATLARRFGATLHLAHVHVPLIAPSGVESVAFAGEWTEIAKERERAYLQDVAARVEAVHGVRTAPALVDGPVADALERHARECRAQLVVMSCHGHLRFRRLWHRGVAEHLARTLPVPVLLARPERQAERARATVEAGIRHVLVPLDGTGYAEGILEHALAVGEPFGARYTLLRVVRSGGGGGGRTARPLEREVAAAREYLQAVAERVRGRGREVAIRVALSPDPASAILEQIRLTPAIHDDPVDLVAIETHPHRPVSRIFVAHTADRVLHGSPVPVLLFEPPLAPVVQAETLTPALSFGA